MTTDPPIRCRDLAVGFGDTRVLDGLSFSVEAGATLALVGRSGCGKTTLLKTLAGIIPPLAGEATVLGATVPAPPSPGSLGYVPQSLGLLEHATVRRNVLYGMLADLGPVRSVTGRFPPAAHRAAREAIDAVGLDTHARRRVSALSGGQRRRVAIARAFVHRPRVLLADEMLSELDPETAASIADCLESLQAETETAVIIVEHDPATVASLADRSLRLDGSRTHTVTELSADGSGATP